MVATAISMAAAIEAWWALEIERKQLLSFGYGIGLQSQTYLGQTRESCFGNWIVVSANAPLLACHIGRVVVVLVRAFERLRGTDLHACF